MQAPQVDEQKVLSRFRERTPRSEEMHKKALGVTPGGVSAGIKYFEPYPVFMKRGEGSHLWDVDDNEYVDYLMSYGAQILGHGDAIVKGSMKAALESVGTTVLGTPTELEVEFGEGLRDLYHPRGLLRFTNSGLEATLLALRIAKGFTGRRKVAKFEGHYHGAVDHFLFNYAPDVRLAGTQESPTPLGDSIDVDEAMLSDSVVLPFNDWEGTDKILRNQSKELACVIMEPFEEGVIGAEPGFIKSLRSLTQDLGVPLIFDEVKTGFRVRLGGAAEFYSVMPDLTCLGKIIGGGLPIGAVVGDGGMMGLIDPRKGNGRKVFHSGTFNGNPLSLSAGKKTVEALSEKGRFERLVRTTEKLKGLVSSELATRGLEFDMQGEGAMFNYYLTGKKVVNYRDVQASDLKLRRLIDLELITRGVYLKPENRFCLALAHSEDDVRLTAEGLGDSLDFLTSN